METKNVVTVAKNYCMFQTKVKEFGGLFSNLSDDAFTIEESDGAFAMKAVYSNGDAVYSVTCTDDLSGSISEKSILFKTPFLDKEVLLSWDDADELYHNGALDRVEEKIDMLFKEGTFSGYVRDILSKNGYITLDTSTMSELSPNDIEAILTQEDMSCLDYFDTFIFTPQAIDIGFDSYEYVQCTEAIKAELEKDKAIKLDMECFPEIADDLLKDKIGFDYNFKDFDTDIAVNLLIDSGNWDYGCNCDDLLNERQPKERLERSSVMYIAKLCNKEKELLAALDDSEESAKDPFVASVMDELENNPYPNGSTMTFLAEMRLSDVMKIIDWQHGYREENKKIPHVNIPKSAMCGLFNEWNGSGSCLEIELPHDIQIPIDKLVVQYENPRKKGHTGTWTVNQTYGLVSSAWKPATLV